MNALWCRQVILMFAGEVISQTLGRSRFGCFGRYVFGVYCEVED